MYKKASRFLQKHRSRRSGASRKRYHLTKEDWDRIRTVGNRAKSANNHVKMKKRRKIYIAENAFQGLCINLFYTWRRQQDALRASNSLKEFGAEVNLIQVANSLNQPQVGRIFYFQQAQGDAPTARKIAQVVENIEWVEPTAYNLPKPPSIPYSLWVVGEKRID